MEAPRPVLLAALLPGAGAYGAYSTMQRVLGAARVGVVLYLGPLYSAVIAWLVLGERIEAFHAVGALFILPGIWLSTRRQRPDVSASEPADHRAKPSDQSAKEGCGKP